jgi:hypothetical protein
MSSPFPGIDPYLEAQGFWEGFHQRYVTYLCDALNDRLPQDTSPPSGNTCIWSR